ncbi:MAG: NAD-dependent epimerase/dehydratase family protein [Candidatus Heimdallarchaeota archaeon]|nr:NAD-dependent epimerase/dehydratase family protein [Candidatus Heimdallarchaeota archaeon]
MTEVVEQSQNNKERCLVIGGLGMLGFEIVKQLLEKGKEVRVLDCQPCKANGFEFIQGDIRERSIVEKACQGVDIVFQTAAAVWNPCQSESIYYEVNVLGNRNVINACKRLNVPKLIYSSTLDVVVDGRKPIVYGDESLPYPKKMPRDPYSRTKIIAEKEVIAANSSDLLTCSLRPVGMYGPRDKYHLPNIIEVAKSKNNIRLGDGSACFSHVYSENAAYAHVLAAEHLKLGSPLAGECYFITDHQPAENLFTFMEPFLERLGYPVPKRSIPYRVAYILAWLAEKIAPKSNFNRFSVVQTCIDHTFVSKKAREDFGYEPIVSKEEAFERTVEWFLRQEEFNNNSMSKKTKRK